MKCSNSGQIPTLLTSVACYSGDTWISLFLYVLHSMSTKSGEDTECAKMRMRAYFPVTLAQLLHPPELLPSVKWGCSQHAGGWRSCIKCLADGKPSDMLVTTRGGTKDLKWCRGSPSSRLSLHGSTGWSLFLSLVQSRHRSLSTTAHPYSSRTLNSGGP